MFAPERELGARHRARTIDRLLLVLLLPWLWIQVDGIWRGYLEERRSWYPFSWAGAPDASAYPFVTTLFGQDSPLRVGDRLLRLGNVDLRGLSRFELRRAARPLLLEGRAFRVEAERSGQRFEVWLEPRRIPFHA